MTKADEVDTMKSGALNSFSSLLWECLEETVTDSFAEIVSLKESCNENVGFSNDIETTGPASKFSNHASSRNWKSKNFTNPSSPPITMYFPITVKNRIEVLCTLTTLRIVGSIPIDVDSHCLYCHKIISPKFELVAARELVRKTEWVNWPWARINSLKMLLFL